MVKIASDTLATSILKLLIREGKRQNYFGFDGNFTEEELNEIDSLVVSKCDDLEGIDLLKNLKSLKIIGVNLNSFKFKGLPNNISDFSLINRLTNLEELTICHDNNIVSLDVSSLKKIKRLNLICNQNLREVKGLDSLTSLEMVCTNGCPIKMLGDPKAYLENTKDTPINILDLRTYNALFSSDELFSYLRTKLMNNLSHLKFSEHIYFYDEMYTLSLEQMRELHRLGMKVITKLKLDILDPKVKALAVYQYVIKNITYDTEGLNFINQHYEKYLTVKSESNNYFLRRMTFINSSLNALKNRKAICDGYVNMIVYLYDLCGIKAEPVICQNKNGELHTAIKIFINDKYIYADPERDSKIGKVYFYGLTLDKMKKIYKLALIEYTSEK